MKLFLKNTLRTATLLAIVPSLEAATLIGIPSINNGGDFSSTGSAPTDIGVFTSSFGVTGQVFDAEASANGTGGDIDIFTFQIASGFQLDSITLTEFVSADDLGFIAIAAGNTIGTNGGTGSQFGTPALISGTTFGTTGVGGPLIEDIFANVSTGDSSSIFLPLGAGEYTVLVQQLGPNTVDFGVDFEVSAVPEPSSFTLIAIGLGFSMARRRRH